MNKINNMKKEQAKREFKEVKIQNKLVGIITTLENEILKAEKNIKDCKEKLHLILATVVDTHNLQYPVGFDKKKKVIKEIEEEESKPNVKV